MTSETKEESLRAKELADALVLERRLTRIETTQYILSAAVLAILVRVYIPY